MRNAWRGFPSTMNISVTTPTSATYTEYADIFTMGAGLVDAWAAYTDTTVPSGSAASPALTYNTSNGTLQLQLNSVSASHVVWGSGSPFATNVIWGTNTVQAFNVIWGTNSPWAQSTPGAELLTISINGDQ